jgi:Arc/MetJ-type ribon-helix-helix transcriptional regulator
MTDYMMNTAYQCGAYQAISQMMRDAIRELQVAEDDFDRKWAQDKLIRLADQLDETQEKFEEAA